jgi:cysteine desulfurase
LNAIYLDHNATTPLDPRAGEALAACLAEGLGNPSSQHGHGRRARRRLEGARDKIGEILGAGDARILFTSGGSEANNLALFGLTGDLERSPARRVIVSSIEHPSVAGPAARLARQGFDVQFLRASPGGVIDLDHLSELLETPTRLVSLMLASNETGVLQPVAEAAALSAAKGALFHTDAVQAVGKIPVDFRALGVDALSLAAHKLHGPPGVGALVVRSGPALEPHLWGGFQQYGLRPGIEPVALAAALVAALEAWRDDENRQARMTALRDELERKLLADERAVIIGARAARLPHVSNVAFVGLDRQALVMALDLAGVAASTGSACASGSSEPSPVLAAMGLPSEWIRSSVRFSLGAFSTADEMAQAGERILLCVNKLRSGNKRPNSPRPRGAERLNPL